MILSGLSWGLLPILNFSVSKFIPIVDGLLLSQRGAPRFTSNPHPSG